MKLTIATCQFPVDADIAANRRHVLRQIAAAGAAGAHIAHFCEGSLSGYAEADFDSFAGFDWALLETATRDIQRAAADAGLWVLLGSSHRLSGHNRPHNSVYVIDGQGRLRDRYDKRFCAGDAARSTGDLLHYTPGDHFCVFTVNGVRCGILICHDYRYPELYREYKRLGVQVMFHSYHAGNMSPARRAAVESAVPARYRRFNHGRIPAGNHDAGHHAGRGGSQPRVDQLRQHQRQRKLLAGFFVRADGVITGRLKRNVSGTLITSVDTDQPLYDSTAAWRARSMDGVYHTGETVDDPRSANRTAL